MTVKRNTRPIEGSYSFDYEVRIYLVDDKSYYFGYLKQNYDNDTVDVFGYRPGFYIDDKLMDWCYENFGDGSNGRFKTNMFYQGQGSDKTVDLNWWISWSYSHELRTHYIIGHFKKQDDAVFFKLRWA